MKRIGRIIQAVAERPGAARLCPDRVSARFFGTVLPPMLASLIVLAVTADPDAAHSDRWGIILDCGSSGTRAAFWPTAQRQQASV